MALFLLFKKKKKTLLLRTNKKQWEYKHSEMIVSIHIQFSSFVVKKELPVFDQASLPMRTMFYLFPFLSL